MVQAHTGYHSNVDVAGSSRCDPEDRRIGMEPVSTGYG